MTLAQILCIVFGLSFLVIVHESGHYFAARAYGMRVLRFSIGLGPAIVRWQPKGSPTVFQIAAIPFLAYVQIDGMNPAEEIDKNDPTLFPNKSLTARAVTLLAGPLANYAAAALLFFGLFAIGGLPRAPSLGPMRVGSVGAGSAAEIAGLAVGDEIFEANGEAVRNLSDLARISSPRAGLETVYRVHRGGEDVTLTITPRESRATEDAPSIGRIGVTAMEIRDPVSIGGAAGNALLYPALLTAAQFEGLARLFTAPDLDMLQGPFAMGQQMAESFEAGWYYYVGLVAAISVALAVFNLLPLPALDGGRLVFVVFELIARRRPNERLEAITHTVGILFLLGLSLIVFIREAFPG